MQRIPCMRCLICVSLGDVWGDGFYHAWLFATADLRLTFLCPKQADIRGFVMTNYLWCEDLYISTLFPHQSHGHKTDDNFISQRADSQ
jgi:hypothetical protein